MDCSTKTAKAFGVAALAVGFVFASSIAIGMHKDPSGSQAILLGTSSILSTRLVTNAPPVVPSKTKGLFPSNRLPASTEKVSLAMQRQERPTSSQMFYTPNSPHWVFAGALVLASMAYAAWSWYSRQFMSKKEALEADHLAMAATGGALSRRAAGLSMATAATMMYTSTAMAFPSDDSQDPIPRSRYVKLPSGVIFADATPGTGKAVEEGDRVSIQWVLRRSNGYFVDSSNVSGGEPFQFVVGDPKGAIIGLDEAIRGMQVGGVRRILIPPPLAYVEGVADGKPGPIPVGYGPRQQVRRIMEVRRDVPGEYIFLEVELGRIYPTVR